MKEFVTRLQEEEYEEEGETTAFMHDDTEVTFYIPDSGQLAVMLAMRNRAGENVDTAEVLIEFMFEIMEDETHRYFRSRLMARKDPFGLEGEGGLFEIFEYLAEEWSGKDSKSPQDYLKSQSETGRSSTGSSRAKASTSSGSRRPASSTSSKSGQSRGTAKIKTQ